MTAKVIGLGKLLKLFGLVDQQLVTELRKELRAERAKRDGTAGSGGGDFHVAFWADAKSHVFGLLRLVEQVEVRVDASKQRHRLYPLLASGFLSWFNPLKRSTNEHIGIREGRVHNHHPFPEYGLTLKVDNILGLQIGHDRYQLVYPYFSEKPILSERWARVGLWLMSQALPDHDIVNMGILDVLRGHSYKGDRLFLRGDEESLFATRYSQILKEWDALRSHYGL